MTGPVVRRSPIVAGVEAHDTAQIEAALDAVSRNLGDAVLGIYQYGSSITSGLQPRSDLDLWVVVGRPTTREERSKLVADLMECSGPRGSRIAGRPLEVTIVRQAGVNPWPAAPEREFQYGEWLRHEYDAGLVPEPTLDLDLAPLLFTALEGSRALVGPPLEALLAPVPHDDLVRAMEAGVPGLLEELAEDTRNVLLTLARGWYTACTGEIASKAAAAAWALQRIPAGEAAAALAHAREVYLGEAEEDFESLGAGAPDAAALMAEGISSQGGC